MRSLKAFMDRLFSEDFWWQAYGLYPQLEAQLAGKIPIFGEIGICKMKPYKIVDADFEKIQHSHTINIYPVAKIGSGSWMSSEPWMWRPGKEATINWADELPERFSEMLATYWQIVLPEDQIVYLGGQAQTDKQFDGQYIDCQWDILCLSSEVLDCLQRQTNLSIVADSDGVDYLGYISVNNDEAYRIVYPQEVVVADKRSAVYYFLDSSNLVQFVRFHRNCAEYITQQGVRIFDNREEKIGGLPCWKMALRQYVDGLRQLAAEEISVDKARAWATLDMVVSGCIDNADNKFGDNLDVLTRSGYLPSSVCVSENMQVRVAFRDKHWWSYDMFFFNDIDGMNPYYIVVKD